MYATEGTRVFFRGLIPPLVSIGGLHAILFGSFAACKRFLDKDRPEDLKGRVVVVVKKKKENKKMIMIMIMHIFSQAVIR
jgi:hypothetical protein